VHQEGLDLPSVVTAMRLHGQGEGVFFVLKLILELRGLSYCQPSIVVKTPFCDPSYVLRPECRIGTKHTYCKVNLWGTDLL